MNDYLKTIRNSPVWKKEFVDFDDVLDNGILKCDEIELSGKIIISMIRTSQLAQEFFEELLENYEISFPQMSLLETIYFSGRESLSQEKLSKMVFCSKANISGMLTRMEEKGYIKRHENPNNKREKLVSITATGEKKLYELFLNHGHCKDKLVSEEEAKTLINSLQKIRNRIKEHKEVCGGEC